MNQDRAREITADCVNAGTWAMLQCGDPPDLSGYTLAEMVEANQIVQDMGPIPNGDGTSTIVTRCDPRLVAALYVLTNYRPESAHAGADGTADPVLVLGNRTLFLFEVPE